MAGAKAFRRDEMPNLRAGDHGSNVDSYIASAPAEARPKLRQMRQIIRSAAPSAAETLKYGMPFYEYVGARLVYFAGHKNHVGVYALTHVESEVPERLKEYLDNRSTLRFPLDRPLPAAAIRDAIRRRMKENESMARENQPGARRRSAK
jgi:uncharacterized protein YdhG (YjbR/CyaY superfamily)